MTEHLEKDNAQLKVVVGISKQEENFGRLKIQAVDGLPEKLQNLEMRLSKSPSIGGATRAMKSEEEIIELNRKNLDLEDQLRRANLERETVEEEKLKVHEELRKTAITYEELKKKSLELIKKMNQAENENTTLRKEKNQLIENILSLQRSHQEELAGLRDTLETLTEKMYMLNMDNENKATALELQEKFDREKERLKQEIASLSQEVADQRNKYSALEGRFNSQADLINELTETERLYFKEKESNATLRVKVEKLGAEIRELEGKVNKAKTKNDGLEKEVEDTRNERAQAREDCRDMSQQRSELQREKIELEAKIENLEKSIENLKELNEIEKEKVSAGEELRKEYEEQSEKNNEILRLSKDEISQLNKTVDTKNKEIEQLEKDRLFFRKKVERLEDQLFAREKSFLRQEAERDLSSDEQLNRFVQENQQLKEEIISK